MYRKQAAEKEKSSIQKDGKDEDVEEMEEPEFLPLDDVLEGTCVTITALFANG